MMTVRQLRDALEHEEGDRVVILSKDAEGNGFSPLTPEFGNDLYVADSSYSGWLSEDEDGDGVPALVLWPVN